MNFSELRFWIYLGSALGLVVAARPFVLRAARYRDKAVSLYDRTAILGIGLFLLGCVSPLTLAIFLFVCVGLWGLMLIGFHACKRFHFPAETGQILPVLKEPELGIFTDPAGFYDSCQHLTAGNARKRSHVFATTLQAFQRTIPQP